MKTALITGASSGIGLELSKIFARDGWRLILSARNRQALDKLASEVKSTHKTETCVIPADLARPEAPRQLFDSVEQTGWQVDALVNNAGFGVHGDFAKTDLHKELDMLQVNIVSLTELTKYFLIPMVARRSGKILNVASTAGFQAGPYMAAYFASKAYVLSFSEAIAHELEGSGVSVTALCPGPTESGFSDTAAAGNAGMFKGATNLPTAADVAKFGYEALMDGKRVAIHGFKNNLLIFTNRLAPRKMVTSIVGSITAAK